MFCSDLQTSWNYYRHHHLFSFTLLEMWGFFLAALYHSLSAQFLVIEKHLL